MNNHSSRKDIKMMAKRTGNKYEAIINAAIKVIAKYGYYRSQVAKIAQEAKVADGTIYLYFENKDDILISLFKEKIGQFVNKIESQLHSNQSPVDQLYQLIRLHLEYLESEPELAVVTQLELRQINPKLKKNINQILKRYLQVIDQIVKEGMEGGVFRPDLDIRITRKMIFGTLDETVTSWIMDHRKYRLSDLADPIHQLFVEGITSNPQGGESIEHSRLLKTDV